MENLLVGCHLVEICPISYSISNYPQLDFLKGLSTANGELLKKRAFLKIFSEITA